MNGYSLLPHQKESLNQVLMALKKENVELLMITGDIYDRAIAPREAIILFDWFLNEVISLNVKVSYIAGNHDSYERTSFLGDVLKKHSVYIGKEFISEVDSFSLEKDGINYHFYLMPFMPYQVIRDNLNDESIDSFNLSYQTMLQTVNLNEHDINIMMTHAFVGHEGTKPEESDSEKMLSVGGLDFVDSSLFKDFDYTLLGHIHKPQSVFYDNVRYTGSIYKYSFSEEKHHKSMLLLDIKAKDEIKETLIPLVMDKEWVTITGLFDDIIKDEVLINGHKNDYVRIILKDEIDVSDGVSKLKNKFPFLMEFSYQKDANFLTSNGVMTEELAKEMLTKEHPEKTMLTLFKDFYQKESNLTLDEIDEMIIKEVIDEIIRSDRDEN